MKFYIDIFNIALFCAAFRSLLMKRRAKDRKPKHCHIKNSGYQVSLHYIFGTSKNLLLAY